MSDDKIHPYLHDYKWINGNLCYWRDNPNYSKETKARLEKWVEDLKKAKNVKRYEPNKNQL